VRIARRDASFAFTFTKIGLHPGAARRGTSSIGARPSARHARAARRDTLDAETALRADIVSASSTTPRWRRAPWRSAVPLDPDLARSVKRTVGTAREEGFRASVELESWAQARSAQRPQIQEAVERMRARRKGRS
jgi:enoyl-CoA hydratase